VFERFTHSAIKAISLGQEEVLRLGHNFLGTEQILLGLILEETSVVAGILKAKGVTSEKARQEVEKIVGHGRGTTEIPVSFTPRSKRVLELTWDEARQLEHNCISAEHLLLGLLREGEGVAVQVLRALEVDLVLLRKDILDSFEQKS
jgi:ATP-dependent Clp protease ATP-binding subunit ClpC